MMLNFGTKCIFDLNSTGTHKQLKSPRLEEHRGAWASNHSSCKDSGYSMLMRNPGYLLNATLDVHKKCLEVRYYN